MTGSGRASKQAAICFALLATMLTLAAIGIPSGRDAALAVVAWFVSILFWRRAGRSTLERRRRESHNRAGRVWLRAGWAGVATAALTATAFTLGKDFLSPRPLNFVAAVALGLFIGIGTYRRYRQ